MVGVSMTKRVGDVRYMQGEEDVGDASAKQFCAYVSTGTDRWCRGERVKAYSTVVFRRTLGCRFRCDNGEKCWLERVNVSTPSGEIK